MKSKLIFRAIINGNGPTLEKELKLDQLQGDGSRKNKSSKDLEVECLRLCLGLKTKFAATFQGGAIFKLTNGKEELFLALDSDLKEVKEEKKVEAHIEDSKPASL